MTETVTVSGVSADASVSPTMTALEQKRQKRIEVEAVEEAELEASIPKPVGYRVLIALPNVEDTFGESGLIKAESTRREEYILSTVGSVLDMGKKHIAIKSVFLLGLGAK
jgi:hypothetical protein